MAVADERASARAEIEEAILDAVQKGFTKVSDLVSYCGPQLINVNTGTSERELDVPQVMRAIERLSHHGFLDREGDRRLGQLTVHLTDAGRDAAPAMTDREQASLDEYGVHPDALRLLAHVIEFEREHGSLPSMSQLQKDTDVDLITYQMQPLYTHLIDAGLATARGLFRFKIDPTESGRTAVDEFGDLVG